MCSSFPVILNLGASDTKPVQSVHGAGPVAILNWDDAKPLEQNAQDTWMLEEVNDTPLVELGWKSSPPTITFDEPRGILHGRSFCNGYSAPYKLDNKQFQIGSILDTRVGCDNEESFFDGLRNADACVVTQTGKLCFLSKGVETLQFSMATASSTNRDRH